MEFEIAFKAWSMLAGLPFRWRLHQVIRSLVIPFGRLLQYVPSPGARSGPVVLLDLGCGHGIFLAVAAKKRPDIKVIGLDFSEEKIAAARRVFEASGIVNYDLAVNFSHRRDVPVADRQAP
jgi:tRNA G46 methylase TrmB